MAETRTQSPALKPVDSLVVDVITDDVSDAYVSKTLFAVSEFTNVVLAGAKVISGETLLCAQPGPRPAAGVRGRRRPAHPAVRHRSGRRHFHAQLRQSRAPAGRGGEHRREPRALGSHGRASAGSRGDREGGRAGHRPRQSRHVQRARGAPQERKGRAGCGRPSRPRWSSSAPASSTARTRSCCSTIISITAARFRG